MIALVTGASSGIGYCIATQLAKRGYDLLLVARRTDKMEMLKNSVDVKCEIISCDLSVKENCFALCEQLNDVNVDILVNCAGFGVFGEFCETDLDKEVDMINTNITALHILTKFFLQKFLRVNRGYILNVASMAAYAPCPTFSSYYASKAYVLRLTQALTEEVNNTGVYVGVLCPGTVSTEFSKVANVGFNIKEMSAEYVAKYAIDKMFNKKTVIIPGTKYKALAFFSRFLPDKILAKITAKFQKKKNNG